MTKPQVHRVAKIIDALHKSAGLMSGAAQILGCTRQTLWNYAQRYPTIKAAIQDSREAITDLAESKLFTAIKAGDAWAICFYLKTKGKDRGYVERSELHTTIDLNRKPLEDYTDEELEWTIQHRLPIESRKQLEAGKG